MKKQILIIFIVFLSLPGFAQRDIKTLDKIGRNAIIAIVGQPDGNEYWGGIMDGCEAIQYPDTYICLDEKTSELIGFNSTSSSFCVLSDYIRGGFKVGDSLAKLKSFDFVHSKYGKNRAGNALKLVDSNEERDYYGAYQEERTNFFFVVKKGVIKEIILSTLDDEAVSYYGCDLNNKPW